MNNSNSNDVTVRFTYDKRTIIDDGHGSPKAVMDFFTFIQKIAISSKKTPPKSEIACLDTRLQIL